MTDLKKKKKKNLVDYFSLKMYFKKHRGSHRIEKCSQGSENTAPNILFKKLNIIYKSILHKRLYTYLEILL